MQKRAFPRVLSFILAFCIFTVDQFSKSWIIKSFEPGESLPVISNIFHLTYVRNPGAAFGVLPFQTSFFIAVSILMICMIIFGEYLFHWWRHIPRLYTALLLGGAAGNLFDRLRFGYVVDFLDFMVWPVFNVADMSLVTGVILLAYSLFKNDFYRIDG